MKRKTQGYIVNHEQNGVQELCFVLVGEHTPAPKAGLLLAGIHVTIFPTYESARNAIRRTVRFTANGYRMGSGKRVTLSWGQKEYYRIVPVRTP